MSGCSCELEGTADLERKTLRALLAINGVMFFGEFVTGWIAESTGLLADSLDMLADASVYGIALYAVGRTSGHQVKAASLSGVLQIALGIGVLLEVFRRLVFGSEPVSLFMMGVGSVALAANLVCLILISRHRDGGVHMRASWIFSANDVIANIGVILSGALVMLFANRLPDLVVGALISIIVVRGGLRILREARDARGGGRIEKQ
jgi:cation diffusion facilitator family transporter